MTSSPDELNAELIDPEQPAPEPFREPVYDGRWICWKCGDLAHLDVDGLCRDCRPERAASFAEVAARALSGNIATIKPRWRIG